ncbi:hypothetical protein QR98_0020760 [Sarcoptes scabiei]|uniref:DUF7153 domain-containing protein n=1 Tax=Sarcoptes scabiei TaxID=52283 RepID=A0A131ZY88_SARSC|nr:hypothetical protein QR98_0020760 [Sarcoptes scabiei]
MPPESDLTGYSTSYNRNCYDGAYHQGVYGKPNATNFGYVTGQHHSNHPKLYSQSSLPSGDLWSYINDNRGLSAVAHKLHRITFVEACIFQPPELPSPVRQSGGGTVGHHASPLPGPSSGHTGTQSIPQRPQTAPVLAQGERSPTSTGGTQYYQEWTSKHMRHLCSRFEKPDQQQLLMNVERKSKYPFIILCTPDYSSSLSKSSSLSSSTKLQPIQHHYRREISHNSAYSLEDDDVDEEEEESWITQKQRDSVNSYYLPPPPPPLLMPHIWPEIRYIDGLYTVCASVVRPGSGVSCEFDEYHYSDMTSSSQQHLRETKPAWSRPAGYIVSAFATFPGEDSDRLEKNWLFWTGARILYKYLPECVGLRRLIFLKRCPDMYREDLINQQSKTKPTIFTGFTYVLLCECFNLKESLIASNDNSE